MEVCDASGDLLTSFFTESGLAAVVYPLGLPYTGGMGQRKTAAKSGKTLYIKNPAAHRLAEKVSKRLGVSLSDAVIAALEDKARKTPRPLDLAKIDEICSRVAALPVLDNRTIDEILGYDEFGIPR